LLRGPALYFLLVLGALVRPVAIICFLAISIKTAYLSMSDFLTRGLGLKSNLLYSGSRTMIRSDCIIIIILLFLLFFWYHIEGLSGKSLFLGDSEVKN
jgi:hypothetical protein